jgi:nucleoside-diphosphate-sugar epimerase
MLEQTIEGKALITGASGFIGGNLRRALLAAGADVVALRRRSSPEPEEGRSVVGAYDDVDGLTGVMREERPDWVFHVAGATNGVTYEDFQRANVLPTKNLLTALTAAHRDVKRFVLVSSLAAYGPADKDRPKVESDPREPIEHYGRSKLEAEQVVEAMGETLPWTIVRPSGVYGPRDREFFLLFREIVNGRNVYYGNRRRQFSLVYVDDCVRAILEAALADETVGDGYFLDDGRPVDWQTFQDAIIAEVGKKPLTIDFPSFLLPLAAWGGEVLAMIDGKPRLFNLQKKTMGDQDAWTCKSDHAREDFGFSPEVDMEEGVRRSLAWYRANGWLKR